MGPIDERRRLARGGHSDGPWLTYDIVYHYFAQSPFYDPMSNNGVIITQAASGLPTMVEAWWFRRKFEAYLRTLNGLEFMVIEDPTENGTKEEHSGVWVIRKQTRSGKNHDVITPIDCYMIIGDVIIMAPTMMNILSSRLVCGLFISTEVTSLTFLSDLKHGFIEQVFLKGLYASTIYTIFRPHLVSSYSQTSGCRDQPSARASK